jgi:imidazolonepropionase-like amidohydrolase
MDAPGELPDSTVLVKGDRIVAVGPSSSTLPAGRTRIIDGAGKFLMPGLADMHAHLSDVPSMAVLVAKGVTTVRNMWGSRQELAWRTAISRGDLLGPTLHTAGPIVDGVPPIWDGSTAVKDAEEARRAVSSQHESGYEFVKVYAKLSRDAYDAIVAEAARVGMPVAGHIPIAVGLEHALDSHQRSIEHLDGYFAAAQRDDSPVKGALDLPSRRRMVDYVDDAKLAHIIDRTRDAGSWNCPTLVVYKSWVSAEDAKALLARPEMRFVSPLSLASWDPTKDFRTKDMTSEDFARLRRADVLRAAIVKRLHDAGARLLLGTDFPNPFVVPGFAVHEELGNLVSAGLTPYEALRAGTKDAAEYLGDDFGEVVQGRRADLLLVDGDPLSDVLNAAKLRGVMVRGVWHAEPELRDMLERAANAWDPSADRLAKLQALAGARTYRGAYSGVFAGQERYAIDRSSDGGRTLVAQSAYDEAEAGSLVTELREQVDARGAVRGFDLRRDAWAGSFRAHIEIVGGEAKGQVKIGEDATAVTATVRDPIPLPGPIGAGQLLVDRARSLPVRGKLDLDAVDIDVEPSPHVVAIREHVQRLPDDRGAHRYAVEEVRSNGKTHFELRVAADGAIEKQHAGLQIGELDVERSR